MEKLIQIQNLSKIYRTGLSEVRALDDICLSVNRGEFIAIVGRSGSGKSTLMNILGCLDTPTLGRYELDGESVDRLRDNRLSEIRNRMIGFIFQGFNLIPGMSALENVELPLIYRGMKKEQRRSLAVGALHKVGLAKRLGHRPGEMSGGQQQRVAIARAIASSPPVILADEPTGNLDSGSGLEVIEILKNLYREGKTVILITHDQEIARTAHRVLMIMDGRIVNDQTKDEKSPRDTFES